MTTMIAGGSSAYANSVAVRLRFFFSSRRRHTRCSRDWSSDVCSSDLFAFRNCGDYELDDSDRPFLDLGHYPWAGPVLGWRSCQQCVLLTAFLFVRSESDRKSVV